MGRFTLNISTDNAAFDEDNMEVARILRTVAERIESDGVMHGACRDFNGNTVGHYEETA